MNESTLSQPAEATWPKITLAVIAYKQEAYIADAIRSALAQTGPPLEILISDDNSPDRTFEVMQAETTGYKGPHKLILNKNPKNLGLARHFNRLWELSSGEFMILQAGDDMSVPDRAESMARRWMESGKTKDLICSYFEEMTDKGHRTGYVKKATTFVPSLDQPVAEWRCGATGACAAYSRKLYDKFGPLHPSVISEDWVYSFRAWLEGGIDLIEQPLVLHRTHDESLSVMAKTIPSLKDRKARHARRHRFQASAHAIALEWQKAWMLTNEGRHPDIERQLQELVALREAQLKAFEATPIQLGSIALTVMRLGGITSALKVLMRHGLRVQ